jgi:uncharacterized protein (TIGR02147 family)
VSALTRPNIFDFRDYRRFLRASIDFERSRQKGAQSRLATKIGCQSAYISMVMADRAEFSAEQALASGEFFGLSPNETQYYLLLLQSARAGTEKLRQFVNAQIEERLQQRSNLAQRLQYETELTAPQKAQYFSAWYFAAIHIGLTVPSLQSEDAIAAYFRLPIATVRQVIEFLVQTGLAQRNQNLIQTGPTRIHTSADSGFANQSHINLRLQAIIDLQRPNPDHFHYSSVVSMSATDLKKLRETMIRAIEEIRRTVRDSREEEVVVYSMDLFNLGSR